MILLVQVLDTVLKTKLDPEAVFEAEGSAPYERLRATLADAEGSLDSNQQAAAASLQGVVWTKALKRMYCLVSRCETAKTYSCVCTT